MSRAAQSQSLARQLSGRWQIPLLVFAVVMLLAGIWRMRPEPTPPTFDELYANAVALKESGFYAEASDYAEALLGAPQRRPAERRRLHRLMAEIIFAHESGNVVHGVGNARAIIEHSVKALAEGESHAAQMHRLRALAWEWLRRPAEAIRDYEQGLAKGIDGVWEVRRRIIELRRTIGAAAEELHAAYEEFLTAPDVPDALGYWAAEQKVELYGLQGDHEEAQRFLASHSERFRDSAVRGRYDYLVGLAWYHVQRLDDAERLLRQLRDQLSPGDPLYGCTGWLLGRILQAHDSPAFALASFEEVLANTTGGPYWTASVLGRAESLAGLERFDESVEAYGEVIRLTTEHPYGGLVELGVVRESTKALYQRLMVAGRLAEAMGYLGIAARLAPPADGDAQAMYSRWLADLSFALGRERLAEAESAGLPADAVERQEAKDHFVDAGDEYLRLARLVRLDGPRSSEATWQAADSFDQAGERGRTAEVLDAFVRERPTSPRAPMALLRLGQTYQALGEYDRAIVRYQQNLVQFPRTLSAAASVVLLADCFTATGRLDKAEQTLLRIVEHRSGDPLSPIEPIADEYREALFRLGDLYGRSGRFEEAIKRYEEALERYGDDPRCDRATYMLADAYRRSASRIREDLQDSKNVAYKDHLRAAHQSRLHRARELYDQVIKRYGSGGESVLAELPGLYVKLSHLYRADVVYDLSRVSDASDLRPYADALPLYDRAAWVYQGDPVAMSAYVQMVNCHLRMGSIEKARMTLQRAKWALKFVEDGQFCKFTPHEDRRFWEDYLSWLERTPAFAVPEPTGSG